MKDMRREILKRTGAAVFALALWQLASFLVGNELLLVSPLRVLARTAELMTGVEFWSTAAFSTLRIAAGFLAGLAVGAGLAAAASRLETVRALLRPLMSAVKATPVASFIILCLIWMSTSGLSVFISFLMVLPVVYSNLLAGLDNADRRLAEMAKVFRIGAGRRIFYILLPGLKPYISSACSVSMGLAWKAGIAAEVIGIPTGSIGERMYQAKIYFDTGELLAWTLVVVLVSVGCEKLLSAVISRLGREGKGWRT